MKINKKSLKGYAVLFATTLGMILVFTAADFFSHSLSAEYSVPPRYFLNKIMYGTLIGFVSLIFLRNQKPFAKAVVFSGIVAVLLQIRYYIEGYPMEFVILFLFIHFGILLLVSFLSFKFLYKK